MISVFSKEGKLNYLELILMKWRMIWIVMLVMIIIVLILL